MDLEVVVAQHTALIANLKESQRESENRVMERIREVQEDMRTEIAKFDSKLDNIDRKLDTSMDGLRKAAPMWASVAIAGLGVLVGVFGLAAKFKG